MIAINFTSFLFSIPVFLVSQGYVQLEELYLQSLELSQKKTFPEENTEKTLSDKNHSNDFLVFQGNRNESENK